ncbi:hypothetical protein EZU46_00730 [Campylobacter upsaliensis]|uniref:hypothetical protein n=1 Tax=Campylobacter upsaliensis TaxID=28080 RepID=UPI00178F84AD|nr:hypothetical protein [Campylobacter upsaliensis]EAH9843232.1 hypothetical protein [Campylobacter upsaliensis]ELB9335008.1 hypothetical protein [Campylobacter upsaliensis]MEB2787536.1 hypothetical protein [Campylobacter upsaliensis]MEB2796599.1 hypothetical protein [Campylobacter upsaliensis]HEC1558756.1 hypothetical protein [Campylobacter upsaliensis]
MKILLLNENPVVSKLINLSAQKMSYEISELSAYEDGIYDVIIVDSDTQADLDFLKDKCKRLIYLNPRNKECKLDVEILSKPFLPTDLLNLLSQEPSKEAVIEDENPYANLNLDLDALNLDDVPNEKESKEEEVGEVGLEDLSLDEEQEGENLSEETLSLEENLDEQEEERENLEPEKLEDVKLEGKNLENEEISNEENFEDLSLDENLKEEVKEEDLELNLSEEEERQESEQEILESESEEKSENLEFENLENEQESENVEVENLKSEEDLLPVVEEQESEVSFDDLPEDAEFLGQEKEQSVEAEETLPVVEENEQEETQNEPLSTEEQIKEELAQLDELDMDINQEDGVKVLEEFKDEPVLDDEVLGVSDEELVVPNVELDEFANLKERDIKQALGEEVNFEEEQTTKETEIQNDFEKQGLKISQDELMGELSQGISKAISASIKDDTLKAALKGMNMNINIKISFDEEGH